MTNTNAAPVPPPGSEAARELGCTCSPAENNMGLGRGASFDSAGREMSRAYYIRRGCPVHDPAVMTMRPLTDAEAGGSHVD